MKQGSNRIAVRPAVLSDIDALWPIVSDPEVVHYSFESGRVSRAVFADWLGAYLSRPDALLFVGTVEERTIGYVRFEREAGSIEVDIAVAKDMRRKGYGRALLRAGLERLAQTWGDADSVLAVVHSRNTASKALFESEGFVLRSMGTRQGVPVYRLSKTSAQ